MKKCEKCTVNPAEFHLINGEEKEHLCNPCCSDSVMGLIEYNKNVNIQNNGKKDGITELELK